MLFFVLKLVYESIFEIWKSSFVVVFWNFKDEFLFCDVWLWGLWLWFKIEFLKDFIVFESIFFFLFVEGRVEKCYFIKFRKDYCVI